MGKFLDARTAWAALAAGAALAGTASAQNAVSADNPAAPAAAPADAATPQPLVKPKDKVVCRSVRYTGSMMPERVCRTVAETERLREELRLRQLKAGSDQRTSRRSQRSGP